MNLIVTAVIGAVLGWLATLLVKTTAVTSVLSTVGAGAAGAVLGPYLVSSLMNRAHGAPAAFVFAIMGAVVAIMILRILNATPAPHPRRSRR
jgi:uncharacterized membrane protein YeaQ/YmgE (transglycosylase-associated protein family)